MKLSARPFRVASKLSTILFAAGLTVFLSVEANAQTNYDYSNTTTGSVPDGSDCADANLLLRTFSVSDSFIIDDLNVGVVIDHTWKSDLIVSLESPTGTRIPVINQVGGSADDYNVRLDDEASTALQSASHNSGAAYPEVTRQPTNALSAFDGEQANGTWTMRVCDGVGQDTGTFLQGHLEFTSTAGGGGGTAVTTYSEDFVGGTTYGNTPGSTQYANWESFRSNAPTSGIQSLTVSGSIDTTGRTCSVAATAQSLMDALRTGGAVTASCDGNNWAVGTCGNSMELTVGSSSTVCQCNTTNYTVRPLITNSNWGGVGTNTCGGSSQTMTVSYSAPSSADPLVVTSTADTDTIGTLRYAINHANANTGDDDITFDIAGAGPHVITLASALPAITDDGVSIDGTTQSGAACGDLWAGTPHTLMVQLDSGATFIIKVPVSGASNIDIRGLSLTGSGDGVRASNAADLSVRCNYVGVAPDGSAGTGGNVGVALDGTTSDALVGGLTAGEGNVLSNHSYGVLTHDGTTGTMIRGNFIGTDPTGTLSRANTQHGINNWMGTVTWADITKNLISGNTASGIATDNDDSVSGASGDVVIAGNYIGTDRAGTAALANGSNGISFGNGSITGVTIGGTSAADRNVISANTGAGINVSTNSDVTILGNYIGANAAGSAALHNTIGISFDGGSNHNVGNGAASGRNIIGASNTTIFVSDTPISDLTISGNYFGVAADGSADITDSISEIAFEETLITNVTISDNVIAGSTGEGVNGSFDTINGLTITGNTIGLNASGSGAVANGGDGINLTGIGSSYTGITIGGTTASDRNVISGNGGDGIALSDLDNVAILGNYIGTNAAGTSAIANTAHGIHATRVNTPFSIGNGTSAGRNLITATSAGVRIQNTNAGADILGNYFNTDATGNSSIVSGTDGIRVQGNTTNIDILDNVFGAVSGDKIEFEGNYTSSAVTIQGNHIGVGADGTTNIAGGTGFTGIRFWNFHSASNVIIGGLGAGEGNIVANNGEDGIYMANAGTITGEILGNTVHNNGWAGILIGSGNEFAITSNSVYSNGQLGIDLGGSRGVTANDAGDGDSGANALLNFPVINEFDAASDPTIDYDINLDVPADAEGYRIEFFKNTSADASGNGEGETYLGSIDTGSHAGGDLNFTGSFSSAASVSGGDIISATATRKTSATTYDITSEFSLTYSATAGTPDLQVVMSVDVYDPDTENLYSLPDNDVVTTLSVTNAGDGAVDDGSINLIIPVSGELTFYNGDFDDTGPETDAVIFSETSSGLSYTAGTNLAFASSVSKPADFAACSYTPATGYDPNVTYVCVNPSGAMQFGSPDPSFTVQFRSRID